MLKALPKTLFRRKFGSALIGILFLLQPSSACSSPEAGKFIDNGGYIVQDGTGRLKFREQDLFLPASTLKILTCLVALEKLGRDYRFETHFFVDRNHNLFIKGFGDPFLTSEALLSIGKELAKRGIKNIRTIFLDESSFALNGEKAAEENSANPYDAPNGALVVNFNALPVHVRRNAPITSGEAKTPIIALMKEAGVNLPPGMHHINIDTLARKGQLAPSLRYCGQLFAVQLQQAGINIENGFSKGTVPLGLTPIYIHRGTKSLEEIVRACLKYSNNYIANQLFLACGVRAFGLPATWDKSRLVYALFAEETLHLGPDQILMREGSGLSRQNRISPAALLAILDLFRPYSDLLNRKGDVLLKSGTMKDVYCYVGYFVEQQVLTPFSILLNQPENTRDRVLKVLHARLSANKETARQTGNRLK